MNSQVKITQCNECGRTMVSDRAMDSYPELRAYARKGARGLCRSCYRLNKKSGTLPELGTTSESTPYEQVIGLAPHHEDRRWLHLAVCRDESPELFFPAGNSGPALAQIAEAKSVCNRCPVKSECLAWSLESNQDAGVWGGLSEDDRRALKRTCSRGHDKTDETVDKHGRCRVCRAIAQQRKRDRAADAALVASSP